MLALLYRSEKASPNLVNCVETLKLGSGVGSWKGGAVVVPGSLSTGDVGDGSLKTSVSVPVGSCICRGSNSLNNPVRLLRLPTIPLFSACGSLWHAISVNAMSKTVIPSKIDNVGVQRTKGLYLLVFASVIWKSSGLVSGYMMNRRESCNYYHHQLASTSARLLVQQSFRPTPLY